MRPGSAIAILKSVLIGLLLASAGYSALLAYDFWLGLRAARLIQQIVAVDAFALFWIVGAIVFIARRQRLVAFSFALSCPLLFCCIHIAHDMYFRGLVRAASAPGFVEQLSAWAYSPEIEAHWQAAPPLQQALSQLSPDARAALLPTGQGSLADDPISIEADRLPSFLYHWLGKPRANPENGKWPCGRLGRIQEFSAQPRRPRYFEFEAIGFTFNYEPLGSRWQEIRDGVYVYVR